MALKVTDEAVRLASEVLYVKPLTKGKIETARMAIEAALPHLVDDAEPVLRVEPPEEFKAAVAELVRIGQAQLAAGSWNGPDAWERHMVGCRAKAAEIGATYQGEEHASPAARALWVERFAEALLPWLMSGQPTPEAAEPDAIPAEPAPGSTVRDTSSGVDWHRDNDKWRPIGLVTDHPGIGWADLSGRRPVTILRNGPHQP